MAHNRVVETDLGEIFAHTQFPPRSQKCLVGDQPMSVHTMQTAMMTRFPTSNTVVRSFSPMHKLWELLNSEH